MKEYNSEATESSEPGIDSIRAAIDAIDKEILEKINKRLGLAKEIGRIKAQNGGAVLDAARENLILRRLLSLNSGPADPAALQRIFVEIIAASRQIQEPLRVAYLGPEATFTHMAALGHFGGSTGCIPHPSIQEVFSDVEKGASRYGVVPVENSMEGAVNHTLDLFFESDLKICSEIYRTISHDLLSLSGKIEDIETIYSHPQAIAQCRRWLRKNLPDIRIEGCRSTAEAAQKASGDPTAAAIASREAGRLYRLMAAASKIEDASRNTTRFLVVGKDRPEPTGNDKTSLLFGTSHIPGALCKALQPAAESGVNLLKLESRPARHENWNYFFFADMQGHIEDPVVKETIAAMKTLCSYMKWLGSYPRAVASDPAAVEAPDRRKEEKSR
jgi:chorismate mutase/prephenate dehydratase